MPPPGFGKRLFRIVAFVLSFAVGACAVWWLSDFFLKWTHASRVSMTLDILPDLRRWQRRTFAEPLHPRVALIGDSVLLADPGTKAVGTDVEWTFEERNLGLRPPLTTLSWPALSPISEYCLADEIIAARPDLIALEVNLRGLQAGPLGPIGFPELAGYIRSDRLVEAAMLPLWDAGITLDRLLFYRALIANGLESVWVRFLDRQARLLRLRDKAELWFESVTHSKALIERRIMLGAGAYTHNIVQGKNRGQRSHILQNLRGAIDGVSPDGTRLRVLGAVLREFREAHVPVLVWVAPVNVEHLRSLGFSVNGLDETVRSIREVAEMGGAAFADFHWILPDAGFRDSGDHVTVQGPVDGSEELGSRLAVAIVRALRQFSPHGARIKSMQGKRALQ